ncbi:MAG TPA: ribose 5-phosphate isomerase B [Vicinamibacteria bacterium]|nr:ribose 5-phosphate isomerase B [Vicinamibacteria bacterium]
MARPLVIAADHAGYELKEKLKAFLSRAGIPFEDLGTHSADSVDYPDYARQVAAAVARGDAERGVLVCGSGQGMAMTANRYSGVRAALPWNEETARLSREHNDANVLALGGRVLAPEAAERILAVWLETPFSGGRHARRVRKMDDELA